MEKSHYSVRKLAVGRGLLWKYISIPIENTGNTPFQVQLYKMYIIEPKVETRESQRTRNKLLN